MTASTRLRLAFMLALSFGLAWPVAWAQPGPRIGLVLGGGGARGTAHVGVLEVLDALRVPVHCVAGTSMGSLVAGAWLGGLTPPQMLERMGKVDWHDLFDDETARGQTNYRERRLAQSYYPGLEAGITPDGLRMARGLVGGQKIKLFFNTLVGADRGERTIESLPLPLSIVATDIGTGERVVFRSGELAAAMRASMSVPAVLAPVAYKGRYLVDGGLVDNLPVLEARERCQADVIIAVDVGSPLLQPQQVQSLASVSLQMINILTEQNAQASRAQLGPGDIYIQPDLKGITAADFGKFREGAARGKAAAEAVAPQLARLALPAADYAAWASRLRGPAPSAPLIDGVQIAGLRHVNPVLVREHLDIAPGRPLDTARLEDGLARVYGEGDFESVDYALLGTRARRILQVTPTEKSWGPDYLRFGVDLQASNKENDFALRAAYHRKWLNRFGGEWLTGVQIGERAILFTQFYQPIEARQRFFVQPALAVARDRLNVYQDDSRIAEYRLRSRGASLGLGVNAGTVGQLRLERTVREIDATVETGAATLPAGDSTLRGWQLVADLDQLDSAFFPSRGWSARAAWFRHDHGNYSRLATELRAARVWGPYVINGRLHYTGSTSGRLPLADAAALGGFLNLSGYVRNQVLADDVRFASLRGEKIIGRMPLGLHGDLRIGLSLEAGSARNRFTETRLDGWQAAASLYLGGMTPLGPLYFGAGLAQGGRSSLYLFIGLP
ncbi:patatin-like phospholipase family protein [Massilia timonae]|uniref:Patatin-like phospholipase family protein n=1 Tax=Massilia timonae TaxID=47229 RepID=A0A1S2NG92_9BURK|nr:patatin-like phospholipase family protein [Massilia timonae]OIJ44055.1 patatin-like phospholipase family protein [Massilia timonae]